MFGNHVMYINLPLTNKLRKVKLNSFNNADLKNFMVGLL